jgi:outer membrane protein
MSDKHSKFENIFLALGLLMFAPVAQAAPSSSATNMFPTEPLSLADAVNLALQQNPSILRGQKDLEATQGIVIQTRAVALPKVNVAGKYSAVEPGAVDKATVTLGGTGFTFGTDQSWSSQIKLTQSLYEGGRIVSSLRAAKLKGELSLLDYQTTVANAVLEAQVAYFAVLLAEQQIIVHEASVELLGQELADTTRRFDAGTVPRFNVLRAEVELANERPKLIRARNSFRISKNNLANLLGLKVPSETLEDIPLRLSGKLEKEPLALDLTRAIGLALEQRSELGSLRKTQALRKEGITSAKSGFLPSVQAVGGYEAGSSLFNSDLTHELHGWLAGVQLSWDIFDGQLTKGKVKEAGALYERAGIELDDTGRRIELEVRTTYSTFIEADEVLESEKKVVEQAEEALRLASSRADAGAGTQLDVLSAQTALTEARTTQIQALHDYAVARARLQRAVGAKWNEELGNR